MSKNDELPSPVTSPFPLWDENVLQTLGLINPDDAKVGGSDGWWPLPSPSFLDATLVLFASLP